MERLAIIGPYPPKYGGVSVHIERLRLLLQQRNIPFIIYNAGSEAEESDGSVVSIYQNRFFWLLRYMFCGKEPSVYLHAPRIESFWAGFFMGLRGKKVFICLHNSRMIDRFMQGSFFHRLLLKWLSAPVAGVICVNTHTVDVLKRLGLSADKIHHYPAFLPPPEEADGDSTPSEVRQFVSGKQPIIAANGRIAWFDGDDLYGLDMLVELVARLGDYENLVLVVYFWDFKPEDEAYLEKLKQKAADLAVQDRILFWTKTEKFYPLLQQSHILLRPTNTDGDAVSIREALWLNVPVVASDVVARPKGTTTFRNRELDSFEEKVREELDSLAKHNNVENEERKLATQRLDSYLSLLSELV